MYFYYAPINYYILLYVCLSPQSGNTPVHYASSDASAEVVQFLLDHGANLHATNQVSLSLC